MSDHLPECPVIIYEAVGHRYVVAADLCICDRLRACEQRVRNTIVTELTPYRASGLASENVLRIAGGVPPTMEERA